MKLKIRRIGNSKGVLLPKKVVAPYEERGVIDLVVADNQLVKSRRSSKVEQYKIKKD